MTAYEAAEIAMAKAIQDERVTGARKLEDILGGNGEYTADLAYEVWAEEMTAMGFADTVA